MSLTYTCDKCGSVFTSGAIHIESGVNIHMENNRVRCPVPGCNGWGHHAAGLYSFSNGIISAFTATGMTREKAEAARDVAKEAASGNITSEDAIKRLEVISGDLAQAIQQSSKRGINWEIILTLLICIYTIWNDRASDEAAKAALAEARTQTDISQKLLEAVQEQNRTDVSSKPISGMRREAPKPNKGATNRHERRKQTAIEKRAKKKPADR